MRPPSATRDIPVEVRAHGLRSGGRAQPAVEEVDEVAKAREGAAGTTLERRTLRAGRVDLRERGARVVERSPEYLSGGANARLATPRKTETPGVLLWHGPASSVRVAVTPSAQRSASVCPTSVKSAGPS